jgi:dipeptide/tripeptide permease
MNTLVNVGGIISPTLTPLIAEKLGWNNALIFAATLAIAGSLLWTGVTHNAVPNCAVQPDQSAVGKGSNSGVRRRH